MRLRRSLSMMAVVAALFGAPSAALGAPPNRLQVPVVEPSAGTTDTPFILTVTYVSLAGNAATSVSASVGGRAISLSRIAGTAANGTWSATTTLPAGTWSVTFTAATVKGPEPSLNGGTVLVAAVIPPSAAPKSASPTPAEGVEPGPDGAASTPVPVPVQDPTGPPGSGVIVASTAPSRTAAPADPAPSSPAGGSGTSGGGVTAPAAGSGAASDAPPAPASSPSPSEASHAAPDASAAPDDAPATIGVVEGDADLVWRVLVGGLVSVAAVALAGAAWLVAGWRRDAQPEATPATGAADGRMRRATTRARAAASEDPVIAAMGLERPRSGRPRASQVHRGPGERDASPPRRPRR